MDKAPLHLGAYHTSRAFEQAIEVLRPLVADAKTKGLPQPEIRQLCWKAYPEVFSKRTSWFTRCFHAAVCTLLSSSGNGLSLKQLNEDRRRRGGER